MKILFVGKKGDSKSLAAADYLKNTFTDSEIIFGERKAKFPEYLSDWNGDYLFSYLSPWVISQKLLDGASKGAINWHPGPPEYPGIGCTNFAIYNDEKVFGITCHYMKAKVDTGKIVEVRRFSVDQGDDVYSITQKCYHEIFISFKSIVDKISNGEKLPASEEVWKRAPYTRRELDALCEITPDMSKKEVDKRIRATTYDRPWAFTQIHGVKFFLK